MAPILTSYKKKIFSLVKYYKEQNRINNLSQNTKYKSKVKKQLGFWNHYCEVYFKHAKNLEWQYRSEKYRNYRRTYEAQYRKKHRDAWNYKTVKSTLKKNKPRKYKRLLKQHCEKYNRMNLFEKDYIND